MKFPLIVWCVMVILGSCHNSADTIKTSVPNEAELIRNRFMPIMNGDWVETSYIDSIKKSRSPFTSQGVAKGLMELGIRISESNIDSVEIPGGSIHEGFSCIAYFRPGKEKESLPLNITNDKGNHFELGYVISSKDTSVVLYKYDKNNSLLSRDFFSKVPDHTESALQYAVNKVFFSGVYENIDSLSAGGMIIFTNDGKVTGIPNCKNYYVLTDFVAASDSSTDEVFFNNSTAQEIRYAYNFNNDTLRLYQIIEDKEKDIIRMGELKYSLLKKPKE